MSVEHSLKTAENGLSRRFPALPLPTPTLDASAAPGASTWLPVCLPERDWRDRLIEESSRVIDAHSPDLAWKRRHIDLVLSGRIHRCTPLALAYVARLAQARMEFIVRSSSGKVLAAPYRGATWQ